MWRILFLVIVTLNAGDLGKTSHFAEAAPVVPLEAWRAEIEQVGITPAIFVRANPAPTQRFGRRFEVQMLFGINVKADFELLRNALVIRNGQPARLFDLQSGDQVFIQHASPDSPLVTRLDAVSGR